MPDHSPRAVPIRETLAGKRILLTGATGFLGQVWLAMLLTRLPEIGRIFVLVRPKGTQTARDRVEEMVNHSPVFAPLHEAHGAGLSAYVSDHIEVLEGDAVRSGLGLDAGIQAHLHQRLDLVVHCAGLIDFNPDLRKAIANNVDATLNVAAFTRACNDAALVHISTCYVAGSRQGLVKEALTPTEAPTGDAFDPRAEYAEIRAEIAAGCEALLSDAARAEIAERVVRGMEKRGIPPEVTAVAENLKIGYEKRWLKERMKELGTAHATRWGFRNIYTYSKFLAEGMLLAEAGDLRLTIIRPSIIESALDFPLPGWNQGLNASAPIVHLGGTWFRFFPSRRALVFDVIPVDLTCNAMTTAAAALLLGEHAPVYQIATSTRNPLTMDRMVDMTMLGHRRWLRRNSESWLDRQVKSRWDPVVVEPDHPLRMENLARGAGFLAGLIERLPADLPQPVRELTERIGAMAKNSGFVFDQIDRILKAFGPFIYDDHYTFEAIAIDRHQPVEPEFAFATESIEWRDYWVNIHMPGLRRWVWPTINGHEIEPQEPEHRFRLQARTPAPRPASSRPGAQPRRQVLGGARQSAQ